MSHKLWGVPLVVWGILCLALTVLWIFVWPHRQAGSATGLALFILRWFHALVWLFLAAAAFIAAFGILGGASTARLVAWLSLATYLVFVGTLLLQR